MADDDDCRALRCAGDSWEDKTEQFLELSPKYFSPSMQYYFYLFSPDRGIPHIACPAAHSLAGTPARVPAHVNSHSTSHHQRGPVVHAPGEYLDGAALLGVPPPLDWGGAAASSAAGAGAAFYLSIYLSFLPLRIGGEREYHAASEGR